MYIWDLKLLILAIIYCIVKCEICELEANCSECEHCIDYSKCNFENIFCKKDNNYYEILDDVYSNLTEYNKNDPDINSFCNSRIISLDKLLNSFTIFESSPNTLSGSSSKLYSCEYIITNEYYLDHESDQAKLVVDINQRTANPQISFDIIFLLYYSSKNVIQYENISDQKIRKSIYNRFLDGLTQVQIFINFKNTNIENVKESLIIKIETYNPSEKVRIIYLAIVIILGVFILAIVALVVIYCFLKRKMIRERERNIHEEAAKKEEKKKLIENFLKNELKSQIFNEQINLNDCDMCTICCDKFIIGESEVSVTPCFHVFHHECIKKWIEEKITNPHCPNCKFPFLEYIENPTKIQIKRSQNSNINIKNDMNINIDNKSEEINRNENTINIEAMENKKGKDNEPPLSEQMRINSLSIRNSNDNNNINFENNINNENNIEVSVHISEEGNNNINN